VTNVQLYFAIGLPSVLALGSWPRYFLLLPWHDSGRKRPEVAGGPPLAKRARSAVRLPKPLFQNHRHDGEVVSHVECERLHWDLPLNMQSMVAQVQGRQ
jgi:hypothetical protein